MGPSRVRWVLVTLVLALGVMAVRAQIAPNPPFDILANVGLPAVDAGALRGDHQVSAPRDHRALRDAIASVARIGPSGAAYAPGRVLVKFRAGGSATVAPQSLRTASPTAAIAV